MCQQWTGWCPVSPPPSHPRAGRKTNELATRLTDQQALVLLQDFSNLVTLIFKNSVFFFPI